jgi:hypothetical protein
MYGYSFGAAKANVWHKFNQDFMLYPGYTPHSELTPAACWSYVMSIWHSTAARPTDEATWTDAIHRALRNSSVLVLRPACQVSEWWQQYSQIADDLHCWPGQAPHSVHALSHAAMCG